MKRFDIVNVNNGKKTFYILLQKSLFFHMVSILQARKPSSVFLPGKFHGNFQEIAFKGQRRPFCSISCLVGYSPWGCKGQDTTEQLSTFLLFLYTVFT